MQSYGYKVKTNIIQWFFFIAIIFSINLIAEILGLKITVETFNEFEEKREKGVTFPILQQQKNSLAIYKFYQQGFAEKNFNFNLNAKSFDILYVI